MHQHSLSEEVNTVRKARLRGWEGVLMFREGERKIGGKRERESERRFNSRPRVTEQAKEPDMSPRFR